MMKKLLALVLALAMFLTVAPAFAENTGTAEDGNFMSMLGSMFGSEAGTEDQGAGELKGLLGGLFGGEGGFDLSALIEPLVQKLSSIKGIKMSDIIDALKDKIGGLKDKIAGLLGGVTRGADSEGGLSGVLDNLFGGEAGSESGFDLGGVLGGLFGESENAEGDLSTLADLLGTGSKSEGAEGTSEDDLNSLLGQLFSSEGEGEGDLDLESLLEAYRNSDEYKDDMLRRDTLKIHLAEEFGLEPGDAQILTYSPVVNYYNDDPNFVFGYFALTNYTADGNALRLKNFGGNAELLTFTKLEDGSFVLANAVPAEDGEGREASIQALCTAFGVTYEDFAEHLDYVAWDEIEDILAFLRENPQYEQIEYLGTLKTVDELLAIREEIVGGILGMPEAAGSAE